MPASPDVAASSGFDLTGRRAIVCGASRGLGLACARALASAGAEVLMVARGEGTLKEAAATLRPKEGITPRTLAADVSRPADQARIVEAMPDPDILVTNADGPPPGRFGDWSRDDWHGALEANMLAPIELIGRVLDGMAARGFGRIVNITSAAVKAPIPALGLSNGARAGLTGFLSGLARQVAGQGITINNILPGPFETGRLERVLQAQAKDQNRPLAEVRDEWLAAIPSGRFGDPNEVGLACLFLCAVGHVTAQNLLLDGGQFPGVY